MMPAVRLTHSLSDDDTEMAGYYYGTDDEDHVDSDTNHDQFVTVTS